MTCDARMRRRRNRHHARRRPRSPLVASVNVGSENAVNLSAADDTQEVSRFASMLGLRMVKEPLDVPTLVSRILREARGTIGGP